ncbi:hypothetical protein ACIBBE_24495 [Streptomyces sp. NPDC051644]|uniref:hypothetical protein n=1 Tax=Streptomyces sp. NPDC051644 TaxID=3365666 RepID=UPI0037B17752
MTVSNSARKQAGQLATKIVYGLWPHADDLKPTWARRHPDDRPLQKDRLAPVTSTSDVQVDDLVLIYDETSRTLFDFLGMRTAREAASAAVEWGTMTNVVIARVTSTTARTLTVVECFAPTGFWKSCNISRFGTVRKDVAARTLRLNTGRRQIGHLGAVSELRERIAQHSQYEQWKAAYAAAQVEAQEAESVRQREWEDRRERQRPQREAARFLNEAAGKELVGWYEPFGGPKVNDWFSEPGRLRTYLAGLNAVGTIGDDAYAVALLHVEVIGH